MSIEYMIWVASGYDPGTARFHQHPTSEGELAERLRVVFALQLAAQRDPGVLDGEPGDRIPTASLVARLLNIRTRSFLEGDGTLADHGVRTGDVLLLVGDAGEVAEQLARSVADGFPSTLPPDLEALPPSTLVEIRREARERDREASGADVSRWDETWHRLRAWTNGQGPSERLAAQILRADGFSEIDPSHPLGGPDGGKDALCMRGDRTCVMAVYFPRGQKDFGEIRAKFVSDLEGARANGVDSIAFVTNQELRLSEREDLEQEWPGKVIIYHLERVTAILDAPEMHGVRRQFLGIGDSARGRGGDGGSGEIYGHGGTIIGGRGGDGGSEGSGGHGGSGEIRGDGGVIVGGDGGNAGTADGRGGRGARSALERNVGLPEWVPSELWGAGRGGSGSNHPEYDRRLAVLTSIRDDYMRVVPESRPFVQAGIERVPIAWVNKRLTELGERWSVRPGPEGYVMPPLED